jgi:uncharacterized protein (TIGR01777 family)
MILNRIIISIFALLMKILITGATGFLGRPLVERLLAGGHEVTRIVRSTNHPGIIWDPDNRKIDASRLEGHDAVIHLAGESIQGRWTKEKKREILQSRTENTSFLVEVLSHLKQKPKIFVSASAIGYYGHRDTEQLSEEALPGRGFLADVTKQWEAASKSLEKEGMRVSCIRTGLVLHPSGGALGKLLLPFKLGLGGPIGNGKQWWSWIERDDLLRIYEFALTNDAAHGPINAVAPNPVINKVFARTLGKVLSRPAIIPLPAFVVKLILGEMGKELLLSSQHVRAKKLEELQFSYNFTELSPALKHLLWK